MINDYYNILAGGTEGKQRVMLFNLAESIKQKGSIVEIGSYYGGSTVYLAEAVKHSQRKVYAVDPHYGGTYDTFTQTITDAGLTDIIIPIVEESIIAAKTNNEPIALLYIDGIHDYENAKNDFLAWFNNVVPDGYVVFHDIFMSGVTKAICGILNCGHLNNIEIHQGLLWAQKNPATTQQKVKYFMLSVILIAIANGYGWFKNNFIIKTIDYKTPIRAKIQELFASILSKIL